MADQLDRIDAYLRNKLPKNEKDMFEQQLSNDPSLQLATQEQAEVIRSVEFIGDEELKAQINDAILNDQKSSAKVRTLRLGWRRVAAIAASFLVLGLALWFMFSKPSNDALFAANYEAYDLSENRRDQQFDAEIQEAIRLYEAKSFAASIPLFEKIYTQTKDSKWLIAQAVSLLETGQEEEAIKKLAPIRANENDVYRAPALWYMALSHLKVTNVERSKILLEEIISSYSGLYKNKAQELLKKL